MRPILFSAYSIDFKIAVLISVGLTKCEGSTSFKNFRTLEVNDAEKGSARLLVTDIGLCYCIFISSRGLKEGGKLPAIRGHRLWNPTITGKGLLKVFFNHFKSCLRDFS